MQYRIHMNYVFFSYFFLNLYCKQWTVNRPRISIALFIQIKICFNCVHRMLQDPQPTTQNTTSWCTKDKWYLASIFTAIAKLNDLGVLSQFWSQIVLLNHWTLFDACFIFSLSEKLCIWYPMLPLTIAPKQQKQTHFFYRRLQKSDRKWPILFKFNRKAKSLKNIPQCFYSNR